MIINKDKTLFWCINKYKPLCKSCVYRYPKLLSHSSCNFFRENLTEYIFDYKIYSNIFMKAGESQNSHCKVNIKFMVIK